MIWPGDMKHTQIILLMVLCVALAGCVTTARKARDGLAVKRIDASLPADQNERSVWLSEHIDPEDSKFREQTTRHWQKDYAVFSEVLLEKAKAAGLDAESLSKALKAVQADAGNEFLAHLPIAAYTSRLGDEPVWILVIHWEQCLPLPPEHRMPPQPLSHHRIYAYTQRDLRLVAGISCR
jgi:hypothetical protein